jgi:cystathionine beta-lyase/cystathionine gamma-synthase
MGFSTDAIHVGQEPDPLTGAVVAPIYQTSTYVFDSLDKNKGYIYARTTHPNRMALERTLAKLEGGTAAYAFTSGMSAIDAVFRLLRPGDHTILPSALYGGTFRLVSQLLVDFGLEFTYVSARQDRGGDQAFNAYDLLRNALEPHDDHHRLGCGCGRFEEARAYDGR